MISHHLNFEPSGDPERCVHRQWHLVRPGVKTILLYDEERDRDVPVEITDVVNRATLGFEPRSFNECITDGMMSRADAVRIWETGRSLFNELDDVLNAVVTMDLLRTMVDRKVWIPFHIVILKPRIESTKQHGVCTDTSTMKTVLFVYEKYTKGCNAEWFEVNENGESTGSILAVVTARVPGEKTLLTNDDVVLGKEFVEKWKDEFERDGGGDVFVMAGYAHVR